MDIETLFQGRALQSSLIGLLSNQIRKAIRRKHTLPIFKIRYKPFFQKLLQEYDLPEIEPSGRLDVNVCELSRLKLSDRINHVFCTLTVSPIAWVQAIPVGENKLMITIDVTIHRAKNQQIGIIFKQCESIVIVENIIPNTPATKANVLPGDKLIYIENKRVDTVTQIYKIVKGLTKKEVNLRLERMIDGTIFNDNGCDEAFDEYEDIDDFANITFEKNTDTVQIGTKSQRKGSRDKISSDGSSTSLPPRSLSNSPKKSPIKSKESLTNAKAPVTSKLPTDAPNSTLSMNTDRNTLEGSSSSVFESDKEDENETVLIEELISTSGRTSVLVDKLQKHTTIDVLANTSVRINDLTHFELDKNSHWLNLCVYGRCNDDVELLGYANIPVPNMLMDCADSNLWQLIRKFTLYPPTPPDL